MLRECVVLNGKVINIGPWDYQYQRVEVTPAEYDDDGNVVKEAVYEDRPMNPLPEGVVIEERDFEYDKDRGWYEVSSLAIPTAEERIKALEEAMIQLLGL